MDTRKIRELAEEALDHFFMKDGKIFLSSDAPNWVTLLTQSAHEGALPNDWKFRFLFTALTCLAHAESEDDLYAPDICPSETWSELLDWLGDDPHATSYVDDALQQFPSEFSSLFDLLQFAQYDEMRNVCDIVLETLREKAEQEQEEWDR